MPFCENAKDALMNVLAVEFYTVPGTVSVTTTVPPESGVPEPEPKSVPEGLLTVIILSGRSPRCVGASRM